MLDINEALRKPRLGAMNIVGRALVNANGPEYPEGTDEDPMNDPENS